MRRLSFGTNLLALLKRLSYREQEDQECVAKLSDDDHRELARDAKGETVCINGVSLS